MTSRSLLLLCLIMSFTLGSCALVAPRGTRVVLITIDTLRRDSFESHMPQLAAWADDAAVFTGFYSATSTTQPSHASMFTGLHPWQHGVSRNGQDLAPERRTIAEILKSAGFSTAAAVASFPVSHEFGFAQGFDVFDDDFDQGKRGPWAKDPQKDGEKRFYSRADTLSQKAIAQLDKLTGSDRQFFWFHYFDPHDPYGDSTDERMTGPMEALDLALKGENPSAAVRRSRELYDKDVSFLDRSLTALLERLENDKDFETHVLIVSDHGDSFGEDGSMGHGTRLTTGQIHVPCLIRSPRFSPGRRTDIAGSIDVAATVLALAGVKSSLPTSRDLAKAPGTAPRVFGMRRVYAKGARFPRLDGNRYPIDTPLFYTILHDQIVRGNSEEVEALPEGLSEGEHDTLRMNLRRLFSTFEETLKKNFKEEDLTPEIRKALEALGYVA